MLALMADPNLATPASRLQKRLHEHGNDKCRSRRSHADQGGTQWCMGANRTMHNTTSTMAFLQGALATQTLNCMNHDPEANWHDLPWSGCEPQNLDGTSSTVCRPVGVSHLTFEPSWMMIAAPVEPSPAP